MKFLCTCGHTVRDQTDFLPCKASLIADQDRDRFYATAWEDLGRLVTAAREGRTREWAAEQFGRVHVADVDLVWQYLSRQRVRYTRHLYECAACGRLWVERTRGGDELVGFAPDSGRVEHVLASEHGSPLDERTEPPAD